MHSEVTAICATIVTSLLAASAAVRARHDARVARRVARLVIPGADRTRTALVRSMGESRLGRMLPRPAQLDRRLRLSGAKHSLEEQVGLKMAAAGAAAGVAGALGLVLASPAAAAVLFPLAAVAGFGAPDLLLARRARARQEIINAQVPDLAELLLTATEAGLGLPLSLVRATSFVQGPLGGELRAAVRQAELGGSWREALDDLAGRADAAALGRLTRALGRSRRLGVPVGATLRGVADELRAERRASAEEAARRAPVKMLFPLVFLILPAFLLLTVGPVLLSTLRSLH